MVTAEYFSRDTCTYDYNSYPRIDLSDLYTLPSTCMSVAMWVTYVGECSSIGSEQGCQL